MGFIRKTGNNADEDAMAEKNSPHKNKIRITDTTLRDAHQSNIATRLKMEDIEKIAEDMDKVGFFSMEVWGGATFDTCIRYLGEDPWERLRKLKKLIKKTPLQMLLRGQNLVGYRHYPDDVVQAFVEKAAENGIDVFRVFDALNDERNLEISAKTIKKLGKHLQPAISFTLSGKKLGEGIYDVEYYVKKAKIFCELGADSICIKDMGGILSPYDAYELVRALKEEVEVPVHVHTHSTCGFGLASYIKAIEAGCDGVDLCLYPLSMRFSQPPLESFLITFLGDERLSAFDFSFILRVGRRLEEILNEKYKELLRADFRPIDPGAIEHQIPGGMLSNLISQLKDINALDKLDEVLEEVPRVRADMGYPPLVTPTSQIIGVQAVQNVMAGRYRIFSKEMLNYVKGMYGKHPYPLSPEIKERVLRGKEPIDKRPGELLEPMLDKAKEELGGLARSTEDVLIYCLFPVEGLKFLREKYGNL